jgi:hypothetical protein
VRWAEGWILLVNSYGLLKTVTFHGKIFSFNQFFLRRFF